MLDVTVESSKTGLSIEYEGGGDLLFFLPLLVNFLIRLIPPLLPLHLSFPALLSVFDGDSIPAATVPLSPRATFGGGETALLNPLTDL